MQILVPKLKLLLLRSLCHVWSEKSRKKKPRVENVYFHCQAFSENCHAQKGCFCTCKMKWGTQAVYPTPPRISLGSVSWGAQGIVLASVTCVTVAPFSFAFLALVTSNSNENNAFRRAALCGLGQHGLAEEGFGICKVGDFPLALQRGLHTWRDLGRWKTEERDLFSPPIHSGESISRC